ncbi:PAS domain S-box protein [Geomonas sp. Red32]|uniref:PAS domain-containing sensor histidine kinase n=1 Tax=Geomonas sp. Red32 TaxID=2912856 RepID=UPI00202CBC64|nr:PAS domain S-box protein [Geomonas sp. Red32]MCM0081448.1 PAS domain S-box protein [Geomonas sp. Red32]
MERVVEMGDAKLDILQIAGHLLDLSSPVALREPLPPFRVIAHNNAYLDLLPDPPASRDATGTAPVGWILSRLTGVQKTGHSFSQDELPVGGAEGPRWFNWQLSPLVSFGVMVAIIEMATEVSASVRARLAAEHALQTEQEKFRTVFNSAAAGVGRVALDGKFLEVNRVYADLLGYAAGELEGMTFQDVTHPDDIAGDLLLAGRLLAGETADYHTVKRYRRKDGTISWVNLSVGLARDRAGEPSYFTAIAVDINDQKRFEEELQKANLKLQLTLDSIAEGYYSLDAGWCFVAANPVAQQYFGRPGMDLIGMNLWEITGWPAGSRVRTAFTKARETGAMARLEFESRLQKGYWIEVHLHPRQDALDVYFTNVSDRKRVEVELQAARDELERRVEERTAELEATVRELHHKEHLLLQQSRLAAMGEMIGNIAHQWRQPLNSLALQVQSLPVAFRAGVFTEQRLLETVEKAMMLIQHMSGTIDDFRNFFKPDKEKTEFHLKEVVCNALHLVEGSFKSRQIEIVVNDKEDPVVYGYPNEYSQVILNVLSNAREVIEARNVVKPRVTITMGASEGRSVLTIGDNAGGIPEEIIYKVFEPHFTTKGAQGTGIGLFMAKNIIEKNMNGRISVHNTAEGAEFTILV